jgi:transposase
MNRLLQETCRTVAEREEKCLSAKEYANLQKRYRNILTRGGKELPEIPEKPKGRRGRIAKSDAHYQLYLQKGGDQKDPDASECV